jgi:hypothetical protein
MVFKWLVLLALLALAAAALILHLRHREAGVAHQPPASG